MVSRTGTENGSSAQLTPQEAVTPRAVTPQDGVSAPGRFTPGQSESQISPHVSHARVNSAASMGCLKHAESGERSLLLPEHLVGRTARAALRLNNSYVSVQHALIRWVGDHWELKDLGSRNGTRVNGEPLEVGKGVRLEPGMRISFGNAEQTWILSDDGVPGAVVVPLDDPDHTIVIDDEMVPLPTPELPAATILRYPDGSWNIEQHDEVAALVDGQIVDVQGRKFRFACPKTLSHTSTIDWPQASANRLKLLSLKFGVSSDEEHVQLTCIAGTEQIELGARAHNYLLLHLARRRLAEAAQGMAQAACGWTHRETLMNELRLDREQLNLDVFRIRKQFSTAGVRDAATIIERRSGTGELRIGVQHLSIERV